MLRAPFLLFVAFSLGRPCLVARAAEAKGDSPGADICGKRSPCRLVSRKDAGKDAAGRSLTVLEVSLGKSKDGEDCEVIEHWLVVTSPDRTRTPTRLLSLCNDGYGAAGVGEDEIDVKPNRFTHTQSGGSAWRWSETTELQLSPLTTLAASSSGWWNLASNASEDEWNWETFKGESRWWSPDCRPDGEPPEDEEPVIGSVPENGYAYLSLPQVPLDPGFVNGEWRTTPLGTCAAHVDSGGKRGYVVHGRPGDPGDARFAAVLDTKGGLYVEVTDDVLVGPSAKWIKDDHLELWLGDGLDGNYQDHCLGPTSVKVQQWGVRLVDGKVFPAFGKPAVGAVRVELARAEGFTRLHIVLARDWKTITVAYSDSDDGKKQKRIIATSRLRYGNPRTLGEAMRVEPTLASCASSTGRLDAQVKPSWTPGKE